MRNLLRALRLLGAVQILLGLAFWTGHAITWVPAHELIGVAFVLVLWAIGLLGATKSGAGAAVAAIGWGILLAGIGFTQQRILIGDFHWIVRVLHLVIAVAAIPLAEVIAKRARNRNASNATA